MADNVAFARAPAQVIEGLLDYTRAEHVKIYKGAIRQVAETLYDCEPEGLYQFLADVQDRADEMGWSRGILMITSNAGDDDEREEQFLQHYGKITLEQVTESELQYIDEEGRMAQDTYMLYKCLMSSLTGEARKKVSLWSSQYRIGENDEVSGVALLKVIIRESHLDTNATTNQLRTKLSNLDEYMRTIDSDISRFNTHVKLLIQALTARNQTTSDLLINLFKGYRAVSDEKFRSWLQRKQDHQEEGNDLEPDDLMQAAKNKYDTMVEAGEWNAPTNEEKIVALNTTIKDLSKKIKAFDKKKPNPTGKDKKSGGKFKKTAEKSSKEHPKEWPVPKNPGDKNKAEYKGNMWYWCGKSTGGKCECWRAHNPKECKGVAASAGGKRSKPDESGEKKKANLAKKLKVAKAYVAKMEQQAATESETEDEE